MGEDIDAGLLKWTHKITAEGLAIKLVRKGVMSTEDLRLLVIRGHLLPRMEAMTDDNFAEIRQELLDFMHEIGVDGENDDTKLARDGSQPARC